MIAAFAALSISGLPFEATMRAVRIGHVDGKLVAFPKDEDLRENSRLNLVVAGHEEGLAMVEASADELTESEMLDALAMAEGAIKEVIAAVAELKELAAKPIPAFETPEVDEAMKAKVFAYHDDLKAIIFTDGKHERDAAMRTVRTKVPAELLGDIADADKGSATKAIKSFYHDLQGAVERECILEGKRTDGRGHTDIRQITLRPQLPHNHGSVLFTRGETQALVSATLGTPDGAAIDDRGKVKLSVKRAQEAGETVDA